MIFKTKEMGNDGRSKGSRCDNSAKVEAERRLRMLDPNANIFLNIQEILPQNLKMVGKQVKVVKGEHKGKNGIVLRFDASDETFTFKKRNIEGVMRDSGAYVVNFKDVEHNIDPTMLRVLPTIAKDQMCVFYELLLRHFHREERNNLFWVLTPAEGRMIGVY
jgi:ribosomal protein L24